MQRTLSLPWFLVLLDFNPEPGTYYRELCSVCWRTLPRVQGEQEVPSAFLPTGVPQRGQLLGGGPSKSRHPHCPELPPGVKLWCPPQDFAEITSLLGSFPSQAGLPPDSLISFSREHFLKKSPVHESLSQGLQMGNLLPPKPLHEC